MNNTTEITAADTDSMVPGLAAARCALERLKDYRDKKSDKFPTSALGPLGHLVDFTSTMGEPAVLAAARAQQFRYAMHSLKRIVEGIENPANYAAIAIKHVVGPAEAAVMLASITPKAAPTALPAGLTPAMEAAFISALPALARFEVNDPDEIGAPDWKALAEPGRLAQCFAAALAAAPKA